MDKPNFLKRLFGETAHKSATPSASDARKARQTIARCHALLSERGEASGASLAREALADVERNDEAYVKEHKVIASSRLASMAKEALLSPGKRSTLR